MYIFPSNWLTLSKRFLRTQLRFKNSHNIIKNDGVNICNAVAFKHHSKYFNISVLLQTRNKELHYKIPHHGN